MRQKLKFGNATNATNAASTTFCLVNQTFVKESNFVMLHEPLYGLVSKLKTRNGMNTIQ